MRATRQLELTISQAPALHPDLIKAFIACNSAPKDWPYKQAFYKLVKEEILHEFGYMAGYDLQVIDHACRRCHNGITSRSRRCMDCDGQGIYSKSKFVLERWILGDLLFHKPINNAFIPEYGLFNNVIHGIINHKHDMQAPVNDLYELLMFIYHYKTIDECLEAIRNSDLPF